MNLVISYVHVSEHCRSLASLEVCVGRRLGLSLLYKSQGIRESYDYVLSLACRGKDTAKDITTLPLMSILQAFHNLRKERICQFRGRTLEHVKPGVMDAFRRHRSSFFPLTRHLHIKTSLRANSENSHCFKLHRLDFHMGSPFFRSGFTDRSGGP